MTTKFERRASGITLMRASGAKGGPDLITGYAAVFNSPTMIGGIFREQFMPGAFNKAIAGDDVRALINHDPGLILGRNTAGTLRLVGNAKGLRVEIDSPDTLYARDLLVSMRRGDVTQMSIGFVPIREDWDESGEFPLRTIREAALFDVSVVTFPAYADTTAEAASSRSPRPATLSAKPVQAGAVVAARARMRLNMAKRGIRVS